MFKNAFGYSLKPIQKICLTGLFIALTAILQKVIAINYIPVVPFVRLSLGGPALIIFASIFLGPLYGLIVGAASDLLGYFIFDPKTMSFFPQITLIYALLGFASYFIFLLIRNLKNEKLGFMIETISLAALATGVSLFFILNNQVTLYSTTYSIEMWQKIVIPVLLFALFGGLVLALFLLKKKFNGFKTDMNIWQVSFACFLIEISVIVLFGSLMKALAFNFNFLLIAICQIVVLFFNVPLNTFFVGMFMKLTNRFKNDR